MSAKRIAKYNKLLVSAIGAIVLLVKEIGFDIDNQAINSTINSIVPIISTILVYAIPNK